MKRSIKEIEQDFSVQKNELIKLENIRADILKTVNRIDSLLDAAAVCWNGEQSEHFCKKAGVINDNISKAPRKLEQIENEIYKITQEYIIAEQQAEQTAQDRQGG